MFIILAIKRVGFSNVRQALSKIFAKHYGDIKDWVWIFLFEFFIIQSKKFITSWLKRWKEKHKAIEVILRFKYSFSA